MSNRRKDEELKGLEVMMKNFQMFKDGKLNCKCPREFNWALGYPTPIRQPKSHEAIAGKKMDCPFSVPAARVNGNIIAGNSWQ